MPLLSTLRAFVAYTSEFRELPFSPRLPQLPAYLLSYVEGRLASRQKKKTNSSRSFSFQLKSKFTVSLEPEQFGMAKGILVDKEYSCLPLSFEPKYILDLGSNIGLGLIALHDRYPQAELAGVEADPRNFQLLLRNLADNHLNFPLIAAAVSGEPGIVGLRIGENSTCSTLIDGSMIHSSHAASIDVPCLTMPQILEHLGWPSVDLLKVDIEGAEENLFSGSPQWLHRVQAIVLEIHPNTSPERIQSFLGPYGFRLRRQSFGREPVFFADRSED